jgi:hypothetical protein
VYKNSKEVFMSYISAFGPLFDLGFEIEKYPSLNDKSYKNDTSPSFWFKTQTGYATLWIDYPNKNYREYDSLRYTIISSENIGDIDSPDIVSSYGDVIFKCELSTQITSYLDNLVFT